MTLKSHVYAVRLIVMRTNIYAGAILLARYHEVNMDLVSAVRMQEVSCCL